MSEGTILQINDLSVEYENEHPVIANCGVSLCVKEKQIIGLIGGNGSGKTTLLKATMGLLLKQARITSGTVTFLGQDITEENGDNFIEYHNKMSRIRGKDLVMIFQQPQTYFDNLMKIQGQMIESIRLHQNVKRHQAKQMALEMLEQLEVADYQKVMKKYPIELSEGTLQKVAIAMALINKPKLILADEPFSALDQLSQNHIMDYLKNYCQQNNASLILVSHDLSLIKEVCDTVYFMDQGKIIESGNCPQFFENITNPVLQDYIAMKQD